MKLKKTRNQIVGLANALASVDGLTGFKLCYAVTKSLDMLASELKAVQKANEQLKDYNAARDALAESCAARNDDGSPKRTDLGFIVAEAKRYNDGLKTLNEEYAAVLEEHKAFMDEEIEVDVHGLKPDDVPDEIDIAQMRAIMQLIE